MLDLYTKQKRAEQANRRREKMRIHIEHLKSKQQEEEVDENKNLLRALRPLVNVTRTEEFREWYRNQRDFEWRSDYENNGRDFIMNLTLAGFSGISDIEIDMDGFAANLEAKIREKVEATVALWRLRLDRVKQATPPWFDKSKIKALEIKRARLNELFPLAAPWHIDHIIPLAGEDVCGLHVHHNMRIIPGCLNSMKKNSFDEELLDVAASIV
jgi:hypothetical protein